MATADRLVRGAADGVTSLPGIGPAVATAFDRLGLSTLQDLWFHLPLRYEDRTQITAIRDLRAGETAQVEARIDAIESGFRYRPQLRIALQGHGRPVVLSHALGLDLAMWDAFAARPALGPRHRG